MKDSLILLISSVMVGLGLAVLLEGIFPQLIDYPLVMSVFGGIISGATYYIIHRLTF